MKSSFSAHFFYIFEMLFDLQKNLLQKSVLYPFYT